MSDLHDSIAHVYDPVKAREYYLRTRKLKGRQKGVAEVPAAKSTTAKAQPAKKPSKQEVDKAHRAKLKADAQKRVDALKARLEKLRKVLQELTMQAKERSGVEPKKTDSKAAAKGGKGSSDGKEKPKTAAQKAKDAKAAKERREKENPSISEQTKKLNAQIKETSEKIKKMRAQLAKDRKRKAKNDAKPTASKSR